MILVGALVGFPMLRAETGKKAATFSEFDGWWEYYAVASASERPGLVKKGVGLAKLRREAMSALIETDPESAIQIAFPEEYHSALPKSIQPLIEMHLRGLARLEVSEKKGGILQRQVTLEEKTWSAYFYGARLNLRSRDEIPIHGVALEGRMAVDGSPLERFPERESLLSLLRRSEGKKTCPICGESGTIPTAVGDILLWFDNEEHLAICEKALLEKEAAPDGSE